MEVYVCFMMLLHSVKELRRPGVPELPLSSHSNYKPQQGLRLECESRSTRCWSSNDIEARSEITIAKSALLPYSRPRTLTFVVLMKQIDSSTAGAPSCILRKSVWRDYWINQRTLQKGV